MTIREELHIDCPPETAFDLMADVRKLTDWNDGASKAEMRSAGPVGPGSTFIAVNRGQEMESTITTFQRPDRLDFSVKGKAMDVAATFRFSGVGSGTQLSHRIRPRPERHHEASVSRAQTRHPTRPRPPAPQVQGLLRVAERVTKRLGTSTGPTEQTPKHRGETNLPPTLDCRHPWPDPCAAPRAPMPRSTTPAACPPIPLRVMTELSLDRVSPSRCGRSSWDVPSTGSGLHRHQEALSCRQR